MSVSQVPAFNHLREPLDRLWNSREYVCHSYIADAWVFGNL